MTTESDHLHSALNAAESRLAELYADQTRAEDEMVARMEVAEKLRAQVREAEKEKRDLQRRYNEQVRPMSIVAVKWTMANIICCTADFCV